MTPEPCTWCGAAVAPGEGYRVGEEPGGGRATFCRLEHVVPWAMKGARWGSGRVEAPVAVAEACARCGMALTAERMTLISHRGAHRIPDGFCSVEHMAQWANAGGRYAR